jgi:hypothetical protein
MPPLSLPLPSDPFVTPLTRFTWQHQTVYPDLELVSAPRLLPDLGLVSARARLLLCAHAHALRRLHRLLHDH